MSTDPRITAQRYITTEEELLGLTYAGLCRIIDLTGMINPLNAVRRGVRFNVGTDRLGNVITAEITLD